MRSSECISSRALSLRPRLPPQDLSPSRGKGLVLLRLLNDLLRRLSKPSRSHLVLSGRILSLLSSVFPLGERSGVNLRGEFNIGNVTKVEDPSETEEEKLPASEEEEVDKDADPSALAAKDDSFYGTFWSMQQYFSNPPLLFASPQEAATATIDRTGTPGGVATPRPSEVGKEEIKADELSKQANGTQSGNATPRRTGENEEGDAATSTSRSQTPAMPPSPLEELRNGTRRILDVFAEASSREREVELAERAATKGGSAASNKKRKREEMLQNFVGADVHGSWKEGDDELEGAFPKFLTGRRVFEYQLRSPPFRRHILLQYLILFQYLLAFNPAQKEKSSDWKNKQLLLAHPLAAEYVLAEDDEQWIRRTWREVVALLEDTGPTEEGRNFKNSALQTLRRESRWIHWKADNCPPIDKPGLDAALVEKCRSSLANILRPRPPFPHILGTPALSELWEQGLEPIVRGKRRAENEEGIEIEIETDGLEQLELPPGIPSVTSYAKLVKQQEARAEMRRRKLGIVPVAEDASEEEKAAAQKKKEELEKADEELQLIEERKTSLNWRALRIARSSTLGLWGKIGGGDVELLLQAEKEEEEAAKKKLEAANAAAAATTATLPTAAVAPAIAPAAAEQEDLPPPPPAVVEEAKQEESVEVPEDSKPIEAIVAGEEESREQDGGEQVEDAAMDEAKEEASEAQDQAEGIVDEATETQDLKTIVGEEASPRVPAVPAVLDVKGAGDEEGDADEVTNDQDVEMAEA